MTLREIHDSLTAILPGYAPACYYDDRLRSDSVLGTRPVGWCHETADHPTSDELAEAAIECGAMDALESHNADIIHMNNGPHESACCVATERGYKRSVGPTRLARLHSAIVQVAAAGGFKP